MAVLERLMAEGENNNEDDDEFSFLDDEMNNNSNSDEIRKYLLDGGDEEKIGAARNAEIEERRQNMEKILADKSRGTDLGI